MFLSMIRELSSSIFLYIPGNETVAVTMLEMWQEARFSNVAILALTLVGIALIVVTLVKRLSGTGHLWHDGHNYHVGEAFALCRVGLRIKSTGRTELYFANRLLGYLVYDQAEQFRPKAYIALPDHKPLAKTNPKSKSKV